MIRKNEISRRWLSAGIWLALGIAVAQGNWTWHCRDPIKVITSCCNL